MNEEFMRRFAARVADSFPLKPGETLEDYGARAVAAGLNKSQRAMLAAHMTFVSDELMAERQIEKTAWIAAARLTFAPGEREPCHVCGKFKSIAQAHHVVPLAAQFDRGFPVPDHEHVWLCPNHHTIIHIFIGPENPSYAGAAPRKRSQTTSALHLDLSEDEFEKMLALRRRAFRSAPE